jgi:hypothetical protein
MRKKEARGGSENEGKKIGEEGDLKTKLLFF